MSMEFQYPEDFFENLDEIRRWSDEELTQITKDWSNVRRTLVKIGRSYPLEERELKARKAIEGMSQTKDQEGNEALYEHFLFTAYVWSLSDKELDRIISLMS